MKRNYTFALVLGSLLFQSHSFAYADTRQNAPGQSPGEAIYRNGTLPSGEPVHATLQTDVEISGKTAACVNCHSRSGLGANEGKTITYDITGKSLFKDLTLKARRYTGTDSSTSEHERPAYTRESLRIALTQGIRSNSAQLDLTMPRYNLSDADYTQLYNYLASLSTTFDDGVDDTEFHVATVIDTGADKKKSSLVMEVLERYLKELNTETRFETKRLKNAPIQKEWHYENYRKVKLHIWEVSGPTDSWSAQLERYRINQPVFALVSGYSEQSWQPVHDFCNSSKIPCIFPSTILPGTSADNYYALYYSAGITLEARVLAKYLKSQTDTSNASPIIQIHDNSTAARTAASAFAAALGPAANSSLTTFSLNNTLSGETFADSGASIVLWVESQHAAKLASQLKGMIHPASHIFVSSLLSTDIAARKQLVGLGDHVFTTHPFVEPQKLRGKMIRPAAWARSRKINYDDSKLLADSFSAIMIAGNALRHLRGNFYRDYVLELLEHKVDNAVVTSTYPRLSIGPGQRYASKGAYIMKIENNKDASLTSVSPWIIPD